MLVCVLTVLLPCLSAGAYPLYGASPKGRYSRSMAWPPMPLYYPPRTTRPVYYPDSDYYYPQEPYYYPVYQSVVPSYYLDQQRPYYYGYDETEPDDGIQEDMSEDSERRESLPYGQETWYQDSPVAPQNNADVNARFLQNLILAQMYSDADMKYPGSGAAEYPYKEEEDTSHWVYGEPVKSSKQKTISKEDEDVRELKSLIRGPERMDRTDKKSRKNSEDLFGIQSKSNDWDEFRSFNNKRSNDIKFASRKSKVPSTTTVVAPDATPLPVRGQKEVVLPRPANSARTPDFHKFVSTRSSTREPSVFDTIKKLLHMEEQLDEEKANSRIQKRSYIDSEESLVAQLGGLKKMA